MFITWLDGQIIDIARPGLTVENCLKGLRVFEVNRARSSSMGQARWPSLDVPLVGGQSLSAGSEPPSAASGPDSGLPV